MDFQRKKHVPAKHLLWSILISGLTIVLLTCCSRGDSPEDQIASLIKDAEEAVEDNRIRDLRKLIDDEYSDEGGRNKKEVINYVVYQTLRQKSIHLFTKIDSIEFPAPDSASVILFAALTGSPVDSMSLLPEINADLYSFEIRLRKNNDLWQVLSAEWRSADVSEIFEE